MTRDRRSDFRGTAARRNRYATGNTKQTSAPPRRGARFSWPDGPILTWWETGLTLPFC